MDLIRCLTSLLLDFGWGLGVQGGGFTLLNVLKLVVVFAAWYGFNIFFNIYNKQLLKMFPYPISCTAFQFLGGSLLAATMWLLRVLEFPQGVRFRCRPHTLCSLASGRFSQ
jgi:hypothetical protein